MILPLTALFINLQGYSYNVTRINVDTIKMYYEQQEGIFNTRIEFIDQTVQGVVETPEEIDLMLQDVFSKGKK